MKNKRILFVVVLTVLSCFLYNSCDSEDETLDFIGMKFNEELQESLDRRSEEEPAKPYVVSVETEGCSISCQYSWVTDKKTHVKRCTRCGQTYGKPEEHVRTDLILSYDLIENMVIMGNVYNGSPCKCKICSVGLPYSYTYFFLETETTTPETKDTENIPAESVHETGDEEAGE